MTSSSVGSPSRGRAYESYAFRGGPGASSSGDATPYCASAASIAAARGVQRPHLRVEDVRAHFPSVQLGLEHLAVDDFSIV